MNNDLIEELSAEVHTAWWEEKKKQGFHAPNECISANKRSYCKSPWQIQDRFDDHFNPKFYKWCDKCHTDMYSYKELPENIKDYDRVTVKMVLNALRSLDVEIVV